MAFVSALSATPPGFSTGPGDRIPVAVSQCLLGARVRFDGGHRQAPLLRDELSRWFAWVPLCPENAIGLGTPREPVHLRRDGEGRVRLVGIRTATDHTDAMDAWSRERAVQLRGLCGLVVAKRSPTCGLERVRLYAADGRPEGQGATGVFTRHFREANPLIPVEEDGRLQDEALRENFVLRVFVLRRWRQLEAAGIDACSLLAFHAAHKYLLMAHSVGTYRVLGRLLADAGRVDADALALAYIDGLMRGLAQPATRKGHTNVLQHLAGYFRGRLPATHCRRLQAVIEEYRLGLVPLAAPLTLLRHFLADFPDDYLARQVYLAPYPDSLRLRAFR